MKYIEYSLVTIGGEGHQPYKEIEASGVSFEGGYLVADDRYVGYMEGSDEQIASALEAMALWNPVELSEADILARAETIQPVNSQSLDGRFVSAARIGEDGRVVRDYGFTEF